MRGYWKVGCAAIVIGGLVGTGAIGKEAEKPKVINAHEKVFGQSLGDWGASWWAWALGISWDRNPVGNDLTGAHCAENQFGPVWFLAGTFGGDAERTCTIPAGRTLFFPIVNSLANITDNPAGCPAPEPGVTGNNLKQRLTDEEKCRVAQYDIFEASIDGVAVRDLDDFSAISNVYEYSETGQTDGLLAGDVGDVFPPGSGLIPGVAGGYWLGVAPLSAGSHTIEFRGGRSGAHGGSAFQIHVIYHLTIGG